MTLVTARLARSSTNTSVTPPRSAENATFVPSGEKSGDSGASTSSSGTRSTTLRVTTSRTISERSFSVRTKNASRSPAGAHDIHGTEFQRPPGCTMYSNPFDWSKPGVRLRTTWPSLVEMRAMSISRSFGLMVIAASRSPEGEGSTEKACEKRDFSGLGARSRP